MKTKDTAKGNRPLLQTELIALVVIWMIAFLAPVLSSDYESGTFWHELKYSMLGLLPFFVLFVLNHFLLIPRLLFHGRHLYYGLLNLVLIVTVYFVVGSFDILHPKPERGHLPGPPSEMSGESGTGRPLDQHVLPPDDHLGPPDLKDGPPNHGAPPFKAASLILSILVIGCDLGITFGFRYVRIQQETTAMEKQYSENKLVFLKQQVSPHFFMNTLNNIHALIDIDQELAKEAVIRLSKLMRYMLYGCESGMSPLGKEMEFVTSYVELMRLRYSEKVRINLNIQPTLPNEKEIPSLIFVSMIENAFKHGISYKKDSFININISQSDDGDRLVFYCENSLQDDPVPQKTDKKEGGIGVRNTKNQLQLIYGDKYEFEIIKDKIFTVKITIPL